MKLYDINQALEALLDGDCTDPETGELLPDIAAALDVLEMERTEKIENLALYLKNLGTFARDIREEETTLAARRHRIERRVERIGEYLGSVLAGEKFSTPRVSISWRKKSSVKVDEALLLASESNKALPGVITYEPKISKTAIKDAITNGHSVEGAEIVTSMSMSIK